MTGVRATVRLQFHAGFTLDDAVPLVDYFAGLGISHLYASPLLAARPGSTHGYDTLDYSRINPELGGREALARLVTRLRERGMGLILDIVPNHMAVGGSGNAWWEDVLAWGQASRCAHMFDIDWNPPDARLRGRVLLPFLAEPYGDCLENGTLHLRHDAADGSFACWHYEHRFPICPDHYADLFAGDDSPDAVLARMAPDHPEGRARLHALLERQHYRLAWWRTASDQINWRRFFDITTLAGLCVEHPDVFDAVHRTVIELYADGLIDGVRVDHIDGLTDPHAYATRLHRALSAAASRRPPGAPPDTPLYVEKILAADEALPADWPIDGTTGYDFLEQVDLLLHDQRGADALDDLWVWGAGGATSFREEEQAAREAVLNGTLAADLARLVHVLSGLAGRDPRARDFTPAALDRVLRQILIRFPVYRTYEGDGGRVLHAVCQAVRPTLVPAHQPVLDWLERQLGPGGPAEAIACFVHLTAPLAAKSVEDTGFYRYGRLLSRNDVGTHPGQFGGTVAAFHAANLARRRDWPRAMLATATHDHKRGEDARARIAVLSELAQEWARVATRWSAFNAPLRHRVTLRTGPCTAPDRADELILYQTLLGAWPLGDSPLEHRITPDFHDRIAAWQVKALREAKRHTSWIDPEPAYEQACGAFLTGLLSAHSENRFPWMVDAFVNQIAPAGALNGLAQTLLHLTSPGVPDLYQGCEFWDFSLVDPDNRRPVDFPARMAALAEGADIASLLPHWRDGRVKQALIAAILRFRATNPALFADGAYRPVRVTGTRRQHLLAFARVTEGATMLVIAPRLSAALMPDPTDLSCPAMLWRGTTLDWDDAPAGPWRSLLHPGRILDRAAMLDLAMLAGEAPLDVLVSG
ncbi:malto-oligosyltrehalose synthase [Gluconacetobacter sp. Hr-1-5]|uniref:malto-oligosyltrehalose synthase n=1 Tax=Gluconacetobacter sp. Hr-1-5 TaxID=3395370 RepID=UPI003B515A40